MILADLVQEGTLFGASHFPEPFGQLEAVGNGWRWEPLADEEKPAG
jgi:hypothetical protein